MDMSLGMIYLPQIAKRLWGLVRSTFQHYQPIEDICNDQ